MPGKDTSSCFDWSPVSACTVVLLGYIRIQKARISLNVVLTGIIQYWVWSRLFLNSWSIAVLVLNFFINTYRVRHFRKQDKGKLTFLKLDCYGFIILKTAPSIHISLHVFNTDVFNINILLWRKSGYFKSLFNKRFNLSPSKNWKKALLGSYWFSSQILRNLCTSSSDWLAPTRLLFLRYIS